MSAWVKVLEELKREARNKPSGELPNPMEIPQAIVNGWRVLLSYHGGAYNMSASLYPAGRSSDKFDWNFLGRIVAALGAPKEPLRYPEDPNAPVHWMWREESKGETP